MKKHRGPLSDLRATFVAAAMLLAFLPGTAHAIPAWARRYNMNCTGCHYPVPPVLNADGMRFKWAGYRMPEAIGTNVEVTKIGDYFSARGVFEYAWAKSSDALADVNGFDQSKADIYAAGPFGKWFGALLEVEGSADGLGTSIELTATFGREDNFFQIRGSQGYQIAEGAVSGFDRPIGVNAPLPIDITIGSAIPFSYFDHTGFNVSWMMAKTNKLTLGVANSMPNISGSTVAQSPRLDMYLSEEFILDEKGGGISAVGYMGNAPGVDPNFPDATSHFYRVGATVNHYFGTLNASGGYVYGQDNDLPTGNLFMTTSQTGQSYWLGAGYTVPSSYLTLYGRWEIVDPNKSVSDDGLTRWVIGGVSPLTTPQNVKLTLEYFDDVPQLSGAVTRQGVNIEFVVVF